MMFAVAERMTYDSVHGQGCQYSGQNCEASLVAFAALRCRKATFLCERAIALVRAVRQTLLPLLFKVVTSGIRVAVTMVWFLLRSHRCDRYGNWHGGR